MLQELKRKIVVHREWLIFLRICSSVKQQNKNLKIFKICAKTVLKINWSLKTPWHDHKGVARSRLWAPALNDLSFSCFYLGGISLPPRNFSLPQQPSAQTADLTSKIAAITHGPIISWLLLFTKFALFFVKKLHHFNTLSCEMLCLMVS